MSLINFQKEKILIHDGLEDAFLENKKEMPCPICGAEIRFGLYNSTIFDDLENSKKMQIASKIRGVKLSGRVVQRYSYKEIPLRLSQNKCSQGIHDILVIFTYEEIQPARYQSYIIGVFSSFDV